MASHPDDFKFVDDEREPDEFRIELGPFDVEETWFVPEPQPGQAPAGRVTDGARPRSGWPRGDFVFEDDPWAREFRMNMKVDVEETWFVPNPQPGQTLPCLGMEIPGSALLAFALELLQEQERKTMETLGKIVEWAVRIGPSAYQVIRGLIAAFQNPEKREERLEQELAGLIGGEYLDDIRAILRHPDVIASRMARTAAADDARNALGLEPGEIIDAEFEEDSE